MNQTEELEFLRNHFRQSHSFMCALLMANGGKLEISWNDIAVVPHPDLIEIIQSEDWNKNTIVYELRSKSPFSEISKGDR